MNLWIDDVRNPHSLYWRNKYDIPPDIVWVTTYEEAFELIQSNNIEWIGFDNDLGDLNDRQGKHLFTILEEKVITGKNSMFKAVFQTSNTVARQQMLAGYHRLYDWWIEENAKETTRNH